MGITIALAGNPNCGKTTLFNALTGSNQYVGNWPGVTVEKKGGKLKSNKEIEIVDLPGIYSLSPYTLEEVIARNYLEKERPDAIINIVDGTNVERNLYLTTQLMELGIPVVIAINMMDVVEKNGDKIDIKKLSDKLGCPIVPISALKSNGIDVVTKAAIDAATSKNAANPAFEFSREVQEALDAGRMDDEIESLITGERYDFISEVVAACVVKKSANKQSISDKIDRIVTNRFLALPIFAAVMFLVYFVSVTTVGTWATDWANDGVFGDGWHLFGIGTKAYEAEAEEYGEAAAIVDGAIAALENDELAELVDTEAEDFDAAKALEALKAWAATVDEDYSFTYDIEDEETLAIETVDATGVELKAAVETLAKYELAEPDPADYGVWVPGVPVLVEKLLDVFEPADWVYGLILDGIVAGVGAVLGFVPQILVLFIFLAFLESCGYMSRVAFILDRIFRRFGLSGKSFIPFLVGSGCGVPGIMASRTIENEKDRRMTIMTTTFIPCGAKLPFIAMVAGAIFDGAWWVSPAAYFLGIASIIISGIMLKKTKLFAGDPAPFVMELPAYHFPTVGTVLRSMWERGWSFIKKAGTIILLSTIAVWFFSFFGWVDGSFGMLSEEQIDSSMLAWVGDKIAWIFKPLGFGNWQATVASITGLVAKENIVGTLGILYGAGEATVYQTMGSAFTSISGFAFLAFNLLCAPCFAAMGAIKREMNSRKWFWTAIGYQCGFAYIIGMLVYQFGSLFTGNVNVAGLIVATLIFAFMIYMVVRPNKARNA